MDIDFSQVYIVKPQMMVRPAPKSNDNHPNFVFSNGAPERQERDFFASAGLSASVAASVVGASALSLPIALLIGAITNGGLLAAKISKDKSALQSPIDEAEKKELHEFLYRHGLTLDMAKEFGLVFPPGHPKVDMLYKRHPLADVEGAGKDNVYIPHDKYDEILMAEREAELLKMLVHLGATKITITHTTSAFDSASTKGGVSGGASTLGSVEINANASIQESNSTADKRIFRLSGKKWQSGDTLNRSSFSWVNFEPSWEALIVAREIGGCTAAALEIRENTSFSTDKSLAAKVEYAIYSGSVSAAVEKNVKNEKIYFIEADFREIELEKEDS